MLILDTNVISALRRPERRPGVSSWLRRQREEDLFLSVVTIGEIERGIALKDASNPTFAAELRSWLERTTNIFADRILPFGSAEARIWALLSARLGHDGADLLIAATAISCSATVVTENISDFEPTGVQVKRPN
jgi:predicted nucleic acid-binding protein